MQTDGATLTLADVRRIGISSEQELQVELEALSQLQPGQTAKLERGSTAYIVATREGELWSIVVRREGMWTAQSFTAEMTSEYSERRVREGRQHSSLRSRLMWWLRSPPAERALSTDQVRTLFSEYLAGGRFTLPISGAGA